MALLSLLSLIDITPPFDLKCCTITLLIHPSQKTRHRTEQTMWLKQSSINIPQWHCWKQSYPLKSENKAQNSADYGINTASHQHSSVTLLKAILSTQVDTVDILHKLNVWICNYWCWYKYGEIRIIEEVYCVNYLVFTELITVSCTETVKLMCLHSKLIKNKIY